ncbi:Gfo/Idh/MocA family oxidoreductase [Pseudoalteromonas sp. XMcav11-Q]|uniref:Gfo/Idh/MocA family protein n=1 Tax=Pseudoalteromonas sp. XMcav11-Q TaxID=3136665 RepID=UPI0032C44D48
MDILNWGVIGSSNVAKKHVDSLLKLDGVALKSISDPFFDKTMNLKGNMDFYHNYKEMIIGGGLDIVSVCSPTHMHFDMAKTLLSCGIHVLLEKPPCLHLDELAELEDISLTTKAKVFNVLQYRFNPVINCLKLLLDDNLLGKPLTVNILVSWKRKPEYYLESDWRGKKSLEGGMLFNQLFHHLDLLTFLFGEILPKKKLADRLSYNFLETEDTVSLLLRAKEGPLINLTATVAGFGTNTENLDIITEKARIRLSGKRLSNIELLESSSDIYAFLSDNDYLSAKSERDIDAYLYTALIEHVLRDLKGLHSLAPRLSDVLPSVSIASSLNSELYK